MVRIVLIAVLVVFSQASHAIVKPISSKENPNFDRVKYGTDIIELYVKEGIFTEIELSAGETDIQFEMGDREAWTVQTAGNLFSLKPKAPMPDTNLKIWSPKSPRRYWFKIITVKPEQSKPAKPEVWTLQFDYPPDPPPPPAQIAPEVIAAQLAAQQKQAIESHLKPKLDTPAPVREEADAEGSDRRINGTYGIIGPEELTPTSVYDNGEMTAITFAPNNPMPSIFMKEADGSESRVPYHIENDMMIVHRVARRFVLRRGKAVACLINGDFNPTGSNSKTNTVSDFVKREIKGAD